ncbi:hypothetical protein O6H91_20G039000 [Diphasiastrum complanatum]|uniref:Uncharacterized protein n=5 Tax=Diphasiastrum complanatum TaxID=34168 RepID=A0ACC2APM1_DIPCM|nr:hypothetical protein O6H91_20G039000 [Diphasiastrum complanatum]KAJ7519449.1 hypothetical protein O6H91_20G039000 [Diphasiastrum complanatum]KAJ7519450.1 hypothetical protein O6H91_20G039000 [Diphasiastrum complanatum]KAJ7519451.1 hypothetical protein O6H91_20G039000 [Diphasiastrum complanatum]KAJ7519452.1 hypothetical protein O6H91_20G039000 [Diphasiastrum complanatum]
MAKLSSQMFVGIALALMTQLLILRARGAPENCTSNSPLVGFEADLSMVQHQLRGHISILDDCSFRVTKFDMIHGSGEVSWWGAKGEDFFNLTNGFPVSAQTLNQTYSNETLSVALSNVTWEQIQVLGVWDTSTASDFGHILLQLYVSDQENGIPAPALSPTEWPPTPAPALAFAPALSPSPLSMSPSPIPSPSPVKMGSPQPTVFENCLPLTQSYRLRWTVNWMDHSVDIGLEAAVTESHYMGFGWAKPGSFHDLMLEADVVVVGFKDGGFAFAEDYYISKYSECNWDYNAPAGVCPDFLFNRTKIGAPNNTHILHGQHNDGIALIRYRRMLESEDLNLDISVNASASMRVIWAIGILKPPDSLRPYYLPQNHGPPKGSTFGYLNLTLDDSVDQCLGPLIASDTERGEIVAADSGFDLVVGVDNAVHYPNPPNPNKVFYVNKKEAPILKVERGVPVTFLIQAGHDVAFYVTSDPIGGASNSNETIYAGGPDAHGVPANPFRLVWLPDRHTPDQIYYQAYFEKKMGWKIDVVDGGLSDMYNSSVFLTEQQVTLFWTLSSSQISFAVRGERKSGYLAIAFGSGMINSFAYVGWVDSAGIGHVGTYWIDAQDASGVHPTNEVLTDRKVRSEKGIITFEFSRPLQPSCDKAHVCKNKIEPSLPLKVVWAMGAKWDADNLTEVNMHERTSSRPTLVYLQRGAAEADQQLQPVLVVHGFMMFLAWGILLPCGVLAARYLKHLENDVWFQMHTYSQYSGIAVMLLALLFAAGELHGLHMESIHVKLGLTSILLACWQPVNAFFRPPPKTFLERQELKRLLWQYLHSYSGRGAMLLGTISLFTGMALLGEKYSMEHFRAFQWALFAWFFVGGAILGYVELRQFWNKRRDGVVLSKDVQAVGGHVQILDSDDEDDSADLLHSGNNRAYGRQYEQADHRGMEVQLEAFH